MASEVNSPIVPDVYTEDQARAIWKMFDGLVSIASEALDEDGWSVHAEHYGDYWEMTGEREGSEDYQDDHGARHYFEIRVGKSGYIHLFGSPPLVPLLLAGALAPLVGPYLDANEQW